MKLFKFTGLLCALAVVFGVACNNSSNSQNNGSGSLSLSVDKDSIKPDGRDKASFTVMFGSEDVTNAALIFDQDGILLDGASFSCLEAGTYSFVATYTNPKDNQSYESNTVQVAVNVLELVSDVVEVEFGGQVKFSVNYEGMDVTTNSILRNIDTEATVSNGVFTAPNYVCELQFQATYVSMKSNVITISVVAPKPAALRLKQNKSRVAAGEQVEFSVLLNGEDVTAGASIVNVETGETLTSNTYTYNGSGIAQFRAEYQDYTSQTVSVGSSAFYKKVLTIEFTSVNCSFCPQMAASLERAGDVYKDRMLHMACHHPAMGADPFIPDVINELREAFPVTQGLPTTFYDYNGETHIGAVTSNEIVSVLRKLNSSNPARAGIAAESTLNGSRADITVNVTASDNKELSLCVMLLENGIIHPQAGAGSSYRHNHTFRKLATGVYGESLGNMTENQQESRKYAFDLSGYNSDNCSIVCAVLCKNDDNEWVVSNATELPVNGWVDYRFE